MNSERFTAGFLILANHPKGKQWVDWTGTPQEIDGAFWVIGVETLSPDSRATLTSLGWKQDEDDQHTWWFQPMGA